MLDICSAPVYKDSASQRKQSQCLKKPHKKRYASDAVSAKAASASNTSDGSSWEGSLGSVCKFYASVPLPCYARDPVDVLEELSSRIMMLPVSQGRILWFLKTYATLAKQGSIFVARGVMGLPEQESACFEALSKLVLPRDKALRAAAKSEVLRKLELPATTVHGTPEDDRLRSTYSYVMAFILQQMIQANDAMGLCSLNTAFSCPQNKVPSISLLLFIQRVMRYLPATKELYIMALIFLDRVFAFNSDLCFTLFNAHRLFVTAVLVASKFMDDLFYTNVFVSKVAGVSPEELNRLEIEFLAAIRFSLYVKPELFKYYSDFFNQIVSVCNMVPVDAEVKSRPCSCSPLIRSSYSVVDELFLHFESERQRVMATPVVFPEQPATPSTLKSLSYKARQIDDSCGSSEDNSVRVVETHTHGRKSTKKTPISLKRPSAVLSSSSRCSTEASCCSSYNSSCSSWSYNSPDF